MRKKLSIDTSKPYIIRKRPDYWAWGIMAIITGGYIYNEYGWDWIRFLLPFLLLFLAVVNFLGRKGRVIMHTEGIQENKDMIHWQDIKKSQFKKMSRHRGGGFWVLSILLKDNSEKVIFIEDYMYDCEEFCSVFNFYSKRFLLVPHLSKSRELLSICLYIALFFALLIFAYKFFDLFS